MDLGTMVEGVVEHDAETGRLVLRVYQDEGAARSLDLLSELERYRGQEIRLIATPLAAIAELAELLASEPQQEI